MVLLIPRLWVSITSDQFHFFLTNSDDIQKEIKVKFFYSPVSQFPFRKYSIYCYNKVIYL